MIYNQLAIGVITHPMATTVNGQGHNWAVIDFTGKLVGHLAGTSWHEKSAGTTVQEASNML